MPEEFEQFTEEERKALGREGQRKASVNKDNERKAARRSKLVEEYGEYCLALDVEHSPILSGDVPLVAAVLFAVDKVTEALYASRDTFNKPSNPKQ